MAVVDDCGSAGAVGCNDEYGGYVGEFVYPVHSAAPIKLFSVFQKKAQREWNYEI